jgi:TolB-like protein/Flp pilus assembly protein TadD
LKHLFAELKRRHVFRVTGVYLVAAWAIVQVAATIFPFFDLADAWGRALVIIAILGLPVVVILTWVFDVTPHGLRRTPSNAGGEAPQIDALELQRRRFAAKAMGFVGLGILVALVGFAAFGQFGPMAGGGSNDSIESIAVLPFVDLSPARDQEFFTDGVTEELLTRLGQVSGLRVAARTSSFAFKNQNIGIEQIGARLRVEAVLEGSVRRDGDNVRVTARLVNARTEEPIWTETYQRQVSSLFAIQDEISAAIVKALSLQLGPTASLADAEGRGTRNKHAQDLYYKGLKAWNERTEEQLQAALQYFQQAIQTDTLFALAYAGLARTYAVLPTVSRVSVDDALREGSAAASRAVFLNSTLGEAYAALGQIAQNLQWDLTSALRSYRRAVRFNPNDAVAHQWYAEALMMTGDLERAGEEIARALEIDPLSPAARSVRAYLILLRGDFAQADSLYQAIKREYPAFTLGALNYAFAAFAARDYAGAAEGLISALPQYAPDVGSLIGAASGQGGNQDAVRAIEGIGRSAPPSICALLYVAIGAHERALTELKGAFDAGADANLPYVLVHPLLRPLHDRPLFQQIVRTVGVTLPA